MSTEPLSLALLALLLGAIVLDLLIGDPRWLPHPVVAMGRLIEALERRWNRGSPRARRLKGFLLTGCVVGLTYALAWGVLTLLAGLHPWLGLIGELLLLASALAIKGLRDAAFAVAGPLAQGDLDAARRAVSMIVGRDTEALDEAGTTRATVETVAENTVDGITAPLFWALLGGAPQVLAYKAVNTLDSMVGHRSERYADFGYASAKLDDLANWVPARLTALSMWLAALALPGARRQGALAGTWRDAPGHPSPNAGWPEGMMARLLGVQLGGVNHYAGQVSERALMGEPCEPLRVDHVRRAVAYMHGAWVVFFLMMAGMAGTWSAWI
ncbi:adenosylcobinamide-phosphate synthase CbiB [Billgrantia kenyensis]|uniref:Cobalamin biosynthesis protein CobD n=1 Tax=Billgrantia kenyensis TaxID=321266 RepID=A0A7W0AE79_9GAMM|nr:adenosylcobinamide-phosphate synthase CbiB [Halomonas kenyensis]MBA2780021.1 cobalamin biosynthesis protein CobD [Halomonas kenyensis]MCG6662964.1 cobalamin biosynthesis protein CobD [Halomonas kenyensis]